MSQGRYWPSTHRTRQSSDKEKDIRTKGRMTIKALKDKLQVEEADERLWEGANKKEELADKKKAWYEEQLVHGCAQSHQVEVYGWTMKWGGYKNYI